VAFEWQVGHHRLRLRVMQEVKKLEASIDLVDRRFGEYDCIALSIVSTIEHVDAVHNRMLR
jgi:hypothetical protein